MSSKEVLLVLGISRPTLSKYVKKGTVKVKRRANGYYDYDPSDIYRLANREPECKTLICSRASKSEKQDEKIANLKNSDSPAVMKSTGNTRTKRVNPILKNRKTF